MKINLINFKLLIVWVFNYFPMEAAPVLHKETIYISANPDVVSAQKVITKFLQWYKVNLNKANSFPILVKDRNDFYSVNKKAVTDYLNYIKSSNCISPKYLEHWQKFFDDKAIQLKKDKLKSDIPEGFDFDFVLITQEPDLLLNQINRAKFKTISINKSMALIGVSWSGKEPMEYEFEMYYGKDGWQISYISTPNFD
jgi:hypothetical protein